MLLKNGFPDAVRKARRAAARRNRQLRIMFTDEARGDKLNVPDNISLPKLPAYSPELNPVENIWQYLRQNQLSNRVFDCYDAIVDACCDAWNALTAEPGRIQSIASRP
jgi:transposase